MPETNINPTPQMNPQITQAHPHRGLVKALIILLVAVLCFFVGYIVYGQITQPDNNIVACTQEAKICPDGSAVGRTGPQCEFAQCPEILDTANWQTYTNEEYGFEFKYPGDLLISEGFVNSDIQFLSLSVYSASQSGNTLNLGLYNNPDGLSLADWRNKFLYEGDIIKEQELSLGSNNWFNFIQRGSERQINYFMIQENNLIYNASVSTGIDFSESDELNLQIQNQILSTFRFIEPKPTYTTHLESNSGIEFQIPNFGIPSEIVVERRSSDRIFIGIKRQEEEILYTIVGMSLLEVPVGTIFTEWFSENVDVTSTLLSEGTFEEQKLENGVTAYKLSGPVPVVHAEQGDPVSAVYAISPEGNWIFSLSPGQERAPSDYGYSNMDTMLDILSNAEF